MISPGLIGLYWLAASFTTATAWALIARGLKRTTRRPR